MRTCHALLALASVLVPAARGLAPRAPPAARARRALPALRCAVDGPSDRRAFVEGAAALALFGAFGAPAPLRAQEVASVGSPTLVSDEIEVTFDDENRIGLELDEREIFYRGVRSRRVYVLRVLGGSQAASVSIPKPGAGADGGDRYQGIQPGFIVVSVNGQVVEGANAKTVRDLIRSAPRPLTIRFRDPLRFNELLQAGAKGDGAEVGTAVKGDDQVFKVEKVSSPSLCPVGADDGDLLEIKYTLRLLEGRLVDGSAVTVDGRGIPGRGGDSTVYFVLGQQGQSGIAAWDAGLRGACVGERRKLTVPSSMAYGPAGLKKRGIEPGSTLVYDITVVGINASSLPQ